MICILYYLDADFEIECYCWYKVITVAFQVRSSGHKTGPCHFHSGGKEAVGFQNLQFWGLHCLNVFINDLVLGVSNIAAGFADYAKL